MTKEISEIYQFVVELPDRVNVKGVADTGEVFIEGKRLSIGKSLKIRNHSPTGFAWGYSGSGPAQLSLAFLLEYMPAEKALAYYQTFKEVFCGLTAHQDFDTVIGLMGCIAAIESERNNCLILPRIDQSLGYD